MADIFISYSRKDSRQALELAENLRSSGMEAWIDQEGIEAATSWSSEIVNEIDSCTVFLLLLSKDSIVSTNVIKEVSIAYESERKILPVELEQVQLPATFRYQLAGIQRVAHTNFDAILRAVKKLGVGGGGESAIGFRESGFEGSQIGTRNPVLVTRSHDTDPRKSLIVLPFEDLSPNKDNEWFADGLASELIDSLTNIKSLRLIDRKTSMDLKGFRGKTKEISESLRVRYFIEGTVRKYGEEIKISIQLLDFGTGEYLWQESHRGEFKDIFDIQEAVAKKVVEGLKLSLTTAEESKVLEHSTENADAYAFYIKANEYFHRQTQEGFGHSIQLLSEAIDLDPDYAEAYDFKGYTLAMTYRAYDRDSRLLEEAEGLVNKAVALKPDLWRTCYSFSLIYRLQGRTGEAEAMALRFVEKAPDEFMSHFSLGFFYLGTGEFAKAIVPLEEAVRIRPDFLPSLWNLVSACSGAQEMEKRIYWAGVSIPFVERYLKLHPDDENQRVHHAALLFMAGRTEEAREVAMSLNTIRDGHALYNVACLWQRLEDLPMALHILRKSIEAGLRDMRIIKTFVEELSSLDGTEEYEIVRGLMAAI
jgi:adenylate cyclase